MSENNKGFTMVELLTTITIMGILMAVGISAVFIYIEKTRKQGLILLHLLLMLVHIYR